MLKKSLESILSPKESEELISAFDQIDPTDFMIVADYLDIEFSTSRKLKPRIEMAPSLIEHPKIQPELVDYLLENK